MAENSNALEWRRSRFCGNQSCVEVAFSANSVLIRDGKHPDAAHLKFDPDDWRAFIAILTTGRA
ncbi:DUF397 domain-containing protein [Dactylosporangium sp. NPDC000244]|uniref:DUF397 domain-containing protein n=1 Tax=Dactylosporangium sp. NPDC000244 TaxID=3154365 RepID=UPI00331940EE